MSDIDVLLTETRTFAPAESFRRAAHVSSTALAERAARDPEAFWAEMAAQLEWMTPWSRVLEWNPRRSACRRAVTM